MYRTSATRFQENPGGTRGGERDRSGHGAPPSGLLLPGLPAPRSLCTFAGLFAGPFGRRPVCLSVCLSVCRGVQLAGASG